MNNTLLSYLKMVNGITVEESGKVALRVLSSLSPELREQVVKHARKHKKALLAELQGRTQNSFNSLNSFALDTENGPAAGGYGVSPHREDQDDPAVECTVYPSGCLNGCPQFRGMTRWFCRRWHWWETGSTFSGELPGVKVRGGKIRHIYPDGAVRFAGDANNPSIPESSLPPLPKKTNSIFAEYKL